MLFNLRYLLLIVCIPCTAFQVSVWKKGVPQTKNPIRKCMHIMWHMIMLSKLSAIKARSHLIRAAPEALALLDYEYD